MSSLHCPVCRKEFARATDVSAEPVRCSTCDGPLTASSSQAIRESIGTAPPEIEEVGMAIAPCPQCGEPVSSLCPACPYCDEPLDDHRGRSDQPVLEGERGQVARLVFAVIGGLTHLYCIGTVTKHAVIDALIIGGSPPRNWQAYPVFMFFFFGVMAAFEWNVRPGGGPFTVARVIGRVLELTGAVVALCAFVALAILAVG